MSGIVQGLFWALALIMIALAHRFGLIADDTANTMLITFPILAALPFVRQSGKSCACALTRRAG